MQRPHKISAKNRLHACVTALCTLLFLLAGCGGGGGSSDSPAQPRPVDLSGAPTADAGPDQGITLDDVSNEPVIVTLNGSASSDPDGDALVFVWVMLAKPRGSQAELSSPLAVRPTFDADVKGSYVFALVVNDGRFHSAEDTVTVIASPGNSSPVANPGPNQDVAVGATVTLDASGSSDPDNDLLTYTWYLSPPFGSSAALSDLSAVQPTFTADVAGSYFATLQVSDGKLTSSPAVLFVNATEATPATLAYAAVTAPAEPLPLVSEPIVEQDFQGRMLMNLDDDYFFAAHEKTGFFNGSESFTWQINDGRELEIRFADERRHLLYFTRRGFAPPDCEIVRLRVTPESLLTSDFGFWQID